MNDSIDDLKDGTKELGEGVCNLANRIEESEVCKAVKEAHEQGKLWGVKMPQKRMSFWVVLYGLYALVLFIGFVYGTTRIIYVEGGMGRRVGAVQTMQAKAANITAVHQPSASHSHTAQSCTTYNAQSCTVGKLQACKYIRLAVR